MLNTPLADTLRERPLVALPLLFGAGLLTSFTPCVYPMIPITAGLLGGAGAAGRSARARVGMTALYVLGVALVYATLGLIAGLTGSIFGGISTNKWALLLMANLLLVSGLALLDVFSIRASSGLLAWAARFGAERPYGAFMMGATSGLVAAPCGAPAFAAVLTFVAATGSAVLGFTYLLAFSLGMTAVLAAVGVFSGALTALPRSGAWLVRLKRAGGVVLLGMAEYYAFLAGRNS
ncbi:MAG: cytochrome c biosis protein transrane region [Gemmatimonadetes bacterium]|jgi:thiol:disulfide interchange protein DsbD|nr:cytochrome c biosis protein transrane region [Gemmatimonadota bacterium]